MEKSNLTLISLIALIIMGGYNIAIPSGVAVTNTEIVYVPTNETIIVPEIVFIPTNETIIVPEIVYITEPAIDTFNYSYCMVSGVKINSTITMSVKGTCTDAEATDLIEIISNSSPVNMSDMSITLRK
jgi:hypothetical protein